MFSVLLVLLIIVSFFMIVLILLQKSEGSGMSGSSAASMFGGALTGASAGNFLTKATAWLATLFFLLCAALAIVVSNMHEKPKSMDLRGELMNAQMQADMDAEMKAQEEKMQADMEKQQRESMPAEPTPVKVDKK